MAGSLRTLPSPGGLWKTRESMGESFFLTENPGWADESTGKASLYPEELGWACETTSDPVVSQLVCTLGQVDPVDWSSLKPQ